MLGNRYGRDPFRGSRPFFVQQRISRMFHCRLSSFAIVWPVLLVVLALPCFAQTAEPIPLTRITEPIVLDGLSDEPAWQDVEPFLLTMYEPVAGLPPSERTEVLAAYDEQYIYFALRAYDSEPSGIRGNILYRDRFGSDDYFEVMLDTFNDNENGLIFTTSPAGIRRDTEISRDASGPPGTWLNADFNTFWDTAVTVNEEGWFAEMRIPFSSLRFQDDNGRVVMGLVAHRIIARKSERSTFPAIEPNADFAFLKPSRAQKIVLEGVYSRRPLYITPYGLAGFDRSAFLADPPLRYHHQHLRRSEIGGDLKYGLTNDLTLDLTVNTDFAQVEADDQQINLTRFSLFFPEKRQFFQERAGIFEFNTGGTSRLFHSRRIGLTAEGEPVRILGGARVVGRIGDWEVGLLDMQTAAHGTLPSENFGVLRLRRNVFNPNSFAGAMATSRIGADGRYNLAYGLDGTFRLFGDEYLSFQWAQTFDRDPATEREWHGLQSGRFSGLLERRRRQGAGYLSRLTWSGPAYDPGIGFVQRHDFTQLDQRLSYTWMAGEASPLIWHTLAAAGSGYLRNDGRSLETLELGPEWSFAKKSGASGSLDARVVHEDLVASFALPGGITIPAGQYTFYRIGANYTMSRNALLRTGARLEGGGFFDGWQASLTLTPNWYVSRHLELAGTYVYNLVRFPERDQRLDSHIARLRIGTALNTQLSTSVFVQYSNIANVFSANARFRYNFREGNDLWIVLNESLNTDRNRLHPSLPLSDSRAVMVKYTYTFALESGGAKVR
jgi:hypothetical protein